MEAAQVQAAELRALHSAVLNKYNLFNVSDHHNQHQPHQILKPRRSGSNKSKQRRNQKAARSAVHDEEAPMDANDLDEPRSSSSAASSTADCFIRPAYEYPVFMPHTRTEDLLQMEAAHDYPLSMEDRRSSMHHTVTSSVCDVNPADSLIMRRERFNYIFDHDNKRNFSSSKYKLDPFYNVSSLHESLNLPPRTKFTSNPLYHEYSSLNLPQGSQGHLYDIGRNTKAALPYSSVVDHDQYHSPPSSFRGFQEDPDLHRVATIKAGNFAQHEDGNFTGRQKALLEFLSEEPSRMRAFNELAAVAPSISGGKDNHHSLSGTACVMNPKHDYGVASAGILGSHQVNQDGDLCTASKNSDHMQAVDFLRMNLPAGDRYTGSKVGDHLHGISDESYDHNPPSLKVRQNLGHNTHVTSENSYGATSSVSCEKCRPILREGHGAAVVPLSDAKDLSCVKHGDSNIHIAASVTISSTTAIKDRHDHKKSSNILKDWLFKGRKKNRTVNEVDHASAASNKDPNSYAAGVANTSTAGTSRVFSGLANPETEKNLEVAMSMDLMELKVLQANNKRDAAIAEVLELRLAMDSMAKKLANVQRDYFNLKSQLDDVNAAMRQRQSETAVDYGTGRATLAVSNCGTDQVIGTDTTDQRERSSTLGVGAHYCLDDGQERHLKLNIDRGISSSGSNYGGWSTRAVPPIAQPIKTEFLNAVAEARVGVKQLCRVLLQHIQESRASFSTPGKKDGVISEVEVMQDHTDKVAAASGADDQAGDDASILMSNSTKPKLNRAGAEAADHENWAPILMMLREINSDSVKVKGAALSMSRGLSYCVESLINMAFYEHFENVGFDKSGTHKVLEPAQRAMCFYHGFVKLGKLTSTQLLKQESPLYNASFDRFCARKIRALGRALGCPGRLWPEEVARTFLAAARAIWLLHHLAFSCHATTLPAIFRVAAHSLLDSRFMEVLPTDHRHVVPGSSGLTVSLMVMPGFFLLDDVIKCKVLA